MKVALVTSWNTPNGCGIEECSRYLIAAVQKADADIQMVPNAAWLDPEQIITDLGVGDYSIVHMNYHAALHSRLTPEIIRRIRTGGASGLNGRKFPVVVTYHDTGVPNSDQCKGVIDAADAAVVHEPFDDLPVDKTHYWRMGVPAAAARPYRFERRDGTLLQGHSSFAIKAYEQQPILGTIGFPFPWKNQIKAAEVAAAAGWGFACICPRADADYVAALKAANPDCYIRTDFVGADEAIRILAACDATAFPYVCNNTGQSGAILQGIAARKPVIALRTCRQFRALWEGGFEKAGDPAYSDVMWNPLDRAHAIRWCENFEDIGKVLENLPLGRTDARIVALAHRESWTNVGRRYADLFRQLARNPQ